MPNFLQGNQLRTMVLGQRVTRAAALQPQTAQAAIFNVVGGKVMVTTLVGEVVVVTPATVNTLKVTGNPTAGTDVDWTSATSTASKEVGSIITLGVTAGAALVVANAGGGNATLDPYIAQIGTIDLVASGSAATGTIKWILTYVPIDDGAYVTAA